MVFAIYNDVARLEILRAHNGAPPTDADKALGDTTAKSDELMVVHDSAARLITKRFCAAFVGVFVGPAST